MTNRHKEIFLLLRVLASKPILVLCCTPALCLLTLASVSIPLASGGLVNAVAYGHSPLFSFLCLAGLLLIGIIINPLVQRFVSRCSRDIETDLQFKLLGKMMELHPEAISHISDGGIVAKLTRDAYVIGGFVRGFYPRGLNAVVMFVSTGVILFARSPLLGIIFATILPLSFVLLIPFVTKFKHNSHHVRTCSDSAFNTLFGFITSLSFLRMLDVGQRFVEEPSHALNALKSNNNIADALSIRFNWMLNLLLICGEIPVVGVAVYYASRGVIPVGDIVIYQMLFISSMQALQGVVGLLPEVVMIRESAKSISEMLEQNAPPEGETEAGDIDSIEFKHVSFAYPNNPSRKVINNLCLSLFGNSVVGMKGSNGCGKSTLIKLAINAVSPVSGEILINGISFKNLNTGAFRKRIGMVFQDNILVPGSIRDNLTLRDASYTESDICSVVNLCGLNEVIRRLPSGLDTRIENGSYLSGGERQRLAIARAIIRNPSILILDEATNHLDARSKSNLIDLINRIRHDRLIIIVGHDKSVEALCDRVISCDNLCHQTDFRTTDGCPLKSPQTTNKKE